MWRQEEGVSWVLREWVGGKEKEKHTSGCWMAWAAGRELFDPNASEAARNKEVTSFRTNIMFLPCISFNFYSSPVFHRILSLKHTGWDHVIRLIERWFTVMINKTSWSLSRAGIRWWPSDGTHTQSHTLRRETRRLKLRIQPSLLVSWYCTMCLYDTSVACVVVLLLPVKQEADNCSLLYWTVFSVRCCVWLLRRPLSPLTWSQLKSGDCDTNNNSAGRIWLLSAWADYKQLL